MDNQPPKPIDYRRPGMPPGDPIAMRMMQLHALTTAGAAGLLLAGLAIVLVAGAIVASILCFILYSLAGSTWIGWWGWFGVYILLLVPLLFWEERRSGSDYLSERAKDFSPSYSSGGEYDLQQFEIKAAVYTDMLRWGPRAIIKSIAGLRGENPMQRSKELQLAANVVRRLLQDDQALAVRDLSNIAETAPQLIRTLKWLDEHDFIGISADGKRVWLSTSTRKSLADLR